MSNGHDLYLDLCAAMAVGALDAGDRNVIEQHLAQGCTECHALLKDLSGPLEVLARSLPPAKPSRGLKARVMVALAQSADRERGAESGPADEGGDAGGSPLLRLLPSWGWAAAAAVLLVAAGVGWWRVAALSDRVTTLESASTPLEPLPPAPPGVEEQWAAFLREHPDAKVIDLAATKDGDAARHARVAYDAKTRQALAHFRDFRAPAGHDFELWTVRDGKPYSEGVVRVSDRGEGLMSVANTGDPSKLAAFAVSDEATGGSKDRQNPRKVHYLGGAS